MKQRHEWDKPSHLFLKGKVTRARHLLGHLGEQVVQQAGEYACVIRGQLAQVEVTQRPQQHLYIKSCAQTLLFVHC